MNQFQQFFNSSAPQSSQQFAAAPRQGGTSAPAGPSVDQLTDQLEYSFIDIPDLISVSDEEEEQLPPEERREVARRQAALQRALAGQGVVGAAPGFDPTPYQQHLAQLAAQQAQQAQLEAQQQAAQQQQAAAAAAAAVFQQQQQQQQQQQFGFPQQQHPQQQQFGFGHFPPGSSTTQ